MTLIVFGYLKPVDLRFETQKHSESFMNIFQVGLNFKQINNSTLGKIEKTVQIENSHKKNKFLTKFQNLKFYQRNYVILQK